MTQTDKKRLRDNEGGLQGQLEGNKRQKVEETGGVNTLLEAQMMLGVR